MIDITEVMQKTSSIYDFYKLGEEGLKHPDILAKEVSRKIKFLQDFTKQPMTEKFFKDGKVPPEEFFASQSMVTVLTKTTQETIKAGVNYLRKQTVVLFHSYIEIIISNIVRMILQREVNILKGIYAEKSKLPFRAEEIIDNKDNIINLMIDKEVNRFMRLSMQQKIDYFKKYFDIDFTLTSKHDFEIDILEIDTLRHNIIHGDKEVIIDDYKMLVINNYIVGLSLYLLTQARLKFKIDVVWTDGTGINYLR